MSTAYVCECGILTIIYLGKIKCNVCGKEYKSKTYLKKLRRRKNKHVKVKRRSSQN